MMIMINVIYLWYLYFSLTPWCMKINCGEVEACTWPVSFIRPLFISLHLVQTELTCKAYGSTSPRPVPTLNLKRISPEAGNTASHRTYLKFHTPLLHLFSKLRGRRNQEGKGCQRKPTLVPSLWQVGRAWWKSTTHNKLNLSWALEVQEILEKLLDPSHQKGQFQRKKISSSCY